LKGEKVLNWTFVEKILPLEVLEDASLRVFVRVMIPRVSEDTD
jgi:hypothetical protein